MDNQPRRYGSIPPTRRLLFAGSCLAIGVLTFIAGLVVNWVTGAPVEWAWLTGATGFVMAAFALYLWIRLSD